MGWSQVVHENRKQAELSRARTEFKQRKRGYELELQPDAGMPALLALAGMLSGTAWWRRSSRTLAGTGGKDWWRKLPVVQQVLQLLQQGPQPARGAVRGKAKPKQVQRKPAAVSLPGSGSQAAAPLVSPTTAQRQASNAQASTSGGAAAKKKKAKKKKK